MPSVAEAWLTLRVDDKQVARDVERGVKEGAAGSEVSKAGDRAGTLYGQAWSDSAGRETDSGLAGIWKRVVANAQGQGDASGHSFGTGFGRSAGSDIGTGMERIWRDVEGRSGTSGSVAGRSWGSAFRAAVVTDLERVGHAIGGLFTGRGRASSTSGGYLRAIFGGRGSGGIGTRLGALFAGGGGLGGSAIQGVGGLATSGGGAAPYLYGALGILGAALGPAILPLALGGGIGGIGALGAVAVGARANKQLQALQKQAAAARGAQRRALEAQVRELRRQDAGPLALYGAGQGVLEAAKSTFSGALTARPSVTVGVGRQERTIQGPSFIQSLVPIFKQIAGWLRTLQPMLASVFRASVPYLKAFVGFLEQASKTLLPAFTQLLIRFTPYLPQLSRGLMAIVNGLVGMLNALGPRGMRDSMKVFIGLCRVAGFVLTALGKIMNATAVAFVWLGNTIIKRTHEWARTFSDFRHRTAVIWDGIRGDIHHYWNMVWTETIGRMIQGQQAAFRLGAEWRHHIANTWDGLRADVHGIWNSLWNNTIGRAIRGFQDLRNSHSAFRAWLARTWNTIWDNTVGRVKRGWNDVVAFFKAAPGRIINALMGLGSRLWNFGAMILNKFLNGIKSVWTHVFNFFKNIPGNILHALGIHSPPDWAVKAGEFIMKGLHIGMQGTIGRILGFTGSLGGLIAKGWHGLMHLFSGGGGGGPGVQKWAGLVRQVLGMLGLSQSLLGPVLYQMQTESGGNPRAINLTDINAQRGDPSKGLMQVIGSTFAAYAGPFRSLGVYNPLANIYAALNYARHVYGPSLMRGGMGVGSGHGYGRGGMIDEPIIGMGPSGTRYTFHRGEAVQPYPDLTNKLLSRLIKAVEENAVTTAAGIAAALDGSARRAAYRGAYSAAGR